MKHIIARVLFYFLTALPLTACGSDKVELGSGPITGQIMDSATKKPIAGAIVLVRWQGVYPAPFGTTICYHVETPVTDVLGRYQTPAWDASTAPPKPEGFRLGPRSIDAYKAGYETYWPPGFDRTQDYKQNVYYLAPFKGTSGERLTYLERMLDATRCGSQNDTERNLHTLYYAMYEEGKNIAVSKEDAEIVDTLRYWASFVIFDKNKPMTRDAKGRLINIDPKSK